MFFYARSIYNILRYFLEILKSNYFSFHFEGDTRVLSCQYCFFTFYEKKFWGRLYRDIDVRVPEWRWEVVLASEPVGGRSRVSELPCFNLQTYP